MVIVSTEVNPVVAARARKLELECRHGCDDKHSTLSDILAKKSISFENVAYLGDDINDLSCLRAVGLPVAVADGHPQATSISQIGLTGKGGDGAAREFCEMVDRAGR